VRLPGSGTIHAAGTTARLDVAIGGSGTALMSRLITRDATALINGGSSIVLTRDPQPRREHPGQRHDPLHRQPHPSQQVGDRQRHDQRRMIAGA
jgi:Putative auto-transporter adhesin, head GIN domain